MSLQPLDYIIKKQLQLLIWYTSVTYDCVTVDVFISVELYLTVTHSTCSTSSANGNY